MAINNEENMIEAVSTYVEDIDNTEDAPIEQFSSISL